MQWFLYLSIALFTGPCISGIALLTGACIPGIALLTGTCIPGIALLTGACIPGIPLLTGACIPGIPLLTGACVPGIPVLTGACIPDIPLLSDLLLLPPPTHPGELPKNHAILREISSLCHQLPILTSSDFNPEHQKVSPGHFSRTAGCAWWVERGV